jgi:quercetin dioxygenase-like cupin family protein
MTRRRNVSIRMTIASLALAAGLAVVMAFPGSATPSTGGQTSTILARGTITGRGTDVVTALNVFPGMTATAVSSSGWHSHPGNTFVIVQSGAITLYKGSNPCHGRTYIAGQAFVEVPEEIYDGVNLGTDAAIVYATFKDVPIGGSPRIDQPAPATCPDPTA